MLNITHLEIGSMILWEMYVDVAWTCALFNQVKYCASYGRFGHWRIHDDGFSDNVPEI